MTQFRMEIPIDAAEALEAVAVLVHWKARMAELPTGLRAQLAATIDLAGDSLEAIHEGPGIAVVMTPDLRALVANLRARST